MPVTPVLAEPTWVARREAHRDRVDRALGDHLRRRREGRAHPVEDFLFSYYALRPVELRRWHPGFGVVLDGPAAAEQLAYKGYERSGTGGVTVSPGYATAQRRLVEATYRLQLATAGRPAQLGCFGLHEWAMVYRLPAEELRHPGWPLRLGAAGTDAVVESSRIACSHFDAYRFFTPAARPLNTLRPRHDDRPAFEQPGCLHAGMDLYKHAGRLLPLVSSNLVLDAFTLARDIRVLDMRASPYDFTALGYPPVPIETPAGKQEYVAGQRIFAERAALLRSRLTDACAQLLPHLD